jgi:hypothetical protein
MPDDLTLADFRPGQRVRYVPYHAHGDARHEDCEDGQVSSVNAHFVFVRFGASLHGQACKPDQLILRG